MRNLALFLLLLAAFPGIRSQEGEAAHASPPVPLTTALAESSDGQQKEQPVAIAVSTDIFASNPASLEGAASQLERDGVEPVATPKPSEDSQLQALLAEAREADRRRSEESERQDALRRAEADERQRQLEEQIRAAREEDERVRKEREVGIKARRDAEERRRLQEEEEAKAAKAAAEEKRRGAEAEAARLVEEAKARRLAEEEAVYRAKAEAEELQRRIDEEAARLGEEAQERRRKDEAETARAKAEAEERLRVVERELAKVKAEAEERKILQEQELAKVKAAEIERQRVEAEAASRAKAEAEEQQRKSNEEAEERRRKDEAETARVKAEAEERQRVMERELAKVKAEAEERKILQEQELAKVKAAEIERQRVEAEAANRAKAEAEEQQRKSNEEAEERRRKDEAETARVKAEAEERLRVVERELAKVKAEAEERQRLQEQELAKLRAAEIERQRAEEERLRMQAEKLERSTAEAAERARKQEEDIRERAQREENERVLKESEIARMQAEAEDRLRAQAREVERRKEEELAKEVEIKRQQEQSVISRQNPNPQVPPSTPVESSVVDHQIYLPPPNSIPASHNPSLYNFFALNPFLYDHIINYDEVSDAASSSEFPGVRVVDVHARGVAGAVLPLTILHRSSSPGSSSSGVAIGATGGLSNVPPSTVNNDAYSKESCSLHCELTPLCHLYVHHNDVFGQSDGYQGSPTTNPESGAEVLTTPSENWWCKLYPLPDQSTAVSQNVRLSRAPDEPPSKHFILPLAVRNSKATTGLLLKRLHTAFKASAPSASPPGDGSTLLFSPALMPATTITATIPPLTCLVSLSNSYSEIAKKVEKDRLNSPSSNVYNSTLVNYHPIGRGYTFGVSVWIWLQEPALKSNPKSAAAKVNQARMILSTAPLPSDPTAESAKRTSKMPFRDGLKEWSPAIIISLDAEDETRLFFSMEKVGTATVVDSGDGELTKNSASMEGFMGPTTSSGMGIVANEWNQVGMIFDAGLQVMVAVINGKEVGRVPFQINYPVGVSDDVTNFPGGEDELSAGMLMFGGSVVASGLPPFNGLLARGILFDERVSLEAMAREFEAVKVGMKDGLAMNFPFGHSIAGHTADPSAPNAKLNLARRAVLDEFLDSRRNGANAVRHLRRLRIMSNYLRRGPVGMEFDEDFNEHGFTDPELDKIDMFWERVVDGAFDVHDGSPQMRGRLLLAMDIDFITLLLVNDMETSGFSSKVPKYLKHETQVSLGWSLSHGALPHPAFIDPDNTTVFDEDANRGRCSAAVAMYKASAAYVMSRQNSGESRPLDVAYVDEDNLSKFEGQDGDIYQYHKSNADEGAGGSSELWLGKQLYWGRNGVDMDRAGAARHFQNVVNGGVAPPIQQAEAHYNLGVMHAGGEGGLPQNEWAAHRHWQEAANLGLPHAQNAIGSWHSRPHMKDGVLVDANQTLAMEWYEKASENGDANAKYSMANAFLSGGGKLGVMLPDYFKAARYMAEAASTNHALSLFELGLALTDHSSWLARLGRVIASHGETQTKLDSEPDVQVGTGIMGKMRYLIVGANTGLEFSLPLGFDCYIGRKLLLEVAHMGKFANDLNDDGLQAYMAGDDIAAAALFDDCAALGVVHCGYNSFFLNDVAEDSDFKRGHARMIRTALANEDDAESIGWLADCYWGGKGVKHCEGDINKKLAGKLYVEASLLGDEKAMYDEAILAWTGSEEAGFEKNLTRAYANLSILASEGRGWFAALSTEYAIWLSESYTSLGQKFGFWK